MYLNIYLFAITVHCLSPHIYNVTVNVVGWDDTPSPKLTHGHRDTYHCLRRWEAPVLLWCWCQQARQCWVLQAGCTSVQSQWVPAKPSTNSFSSVPVSACASWQWTWAAPVVGTPLPPTHTLAIQPPPLDMFCLRLTLSHLGSGWWRVGGV